MSEKTLAADARDVEAIRAVVTDLFAADGLGYLRNATGKLLQWPEAVMAIDKNFDGSLRRERTVNRVEVVHVGDEVAVTELDAVINNDGVSETGEHRGWADRYSGPVELVRVEGRWKVADLLENGVSLREATFVSEMTDSCGPLSVRVLIGRYQQTLTVLICEVTSTATTPVRVTGHAFARHRRGRGRRWEWSPKTHESLKEVPPGRTTFLVDGGFRDRGLGSEVRFLLRTDLGLLDVRPVGVRARKWLPFTRVPMGPLLFLLALGVFAAATQPLWFLGVFALLMVVSFFGFGRWNRTWGARRRIRGLS